MVRSDVTTDPALVFPDPTLRYSPSYEQGTDSLNCSLHLKMDTQTPYWFILLVVILVIMVILAKNEDLEKNKAEIESRLSVLESQLLKSLSSSLDNDAHADLQLKNQKPTEMYMIYSEVSEKEKEETEKRL